MKLGITFLIIGAIIFIDGMIKIAIGFAGGNGGLVVAGIITGLGLGGLLVYFGVKRISKKKAPAE